MDNQIIHWVLACELISFRMIPHMPVALAKLKFMFFWTYDLIYGPRYQEDQNSQNMVPFNCPTHKLSNDTPYAYNSTSKIKIRVFGPTTSFTGLYRYQEGQNSRNMLSFNSPTHKLSNDTPYA